MKVAVYNQEGEEKEKIDLIKDIFGLKINLDLIHQALVTQLANSRQPLAHTKDRSEVRGGGKKPWRQKGTGRARHGSTRSPIWIGGGVTFGPRKEKDYSKKINKKAKKKALLMVLSSKLKDNELIVVDNLKLKERKTKEGIRILNNFEKIINQKSVLLATLGSEKDTTQVFRNIPKAKTIAVRNVNIKDLLNSKYLFISKDGVGEIEKIFKMN
ncbi:MAG TPA: 50S ribosomal protein L4 [Candidatus Portnoybacteria bacterium]|nr:50S ribosomal protein L4 [Candidatus Portnoybacteria bacterium]